MDISHQPRKELEDAVEQNPDDLFNTILLQAELGFGVVGDPEVLSNYLWPDWRPSKVLDLLVANLSAA